MRGKNRTLTSQQRELPSRWQCLSKLTLVIVTISFSLDLSAQEKQFYQRNLPDYAEYISKEYGVTCGHPERFTDLDNTMFCGKFGKKKINIQGDYMALYFSPEIRGVF